MRRWSVLLILLAGCSAPPSEPSSEPAETTVEALDANPPSDLHVRPPRRIESSWENVTYTRQCWTPKDLPCAASRHESHEHSFGPVNADLWLNVTWESNDAANDQLTVRLVPRHGDAVNVTGPSPLSVHLPTPPARFTVVLEGQHEDLVVAYRDAPPQPYSATISYLVG